MLQRETIATLREIRPLDELAGSEIERLVADASLQYFPRGEQVLTQGGSPSDYLYVIRRGTVKMFLTAEDGSEMMLDYRGEGEYFGLISVVSGDPPRSNVVVEEDTISLLIPKEVFLGVLEDNPSVSEKLVKSYFIEFIDKTYEETRRRYKNVDNGHRVLFSAPVGKNIRRDPVATNEDTTIQRAARLMAEQKISSLVITDAADTPVGIITDRDLREKVVAEGRDLSRPVSDIMVSPIIQVEASEPSSEALYKMMRHNIHHILVTENGKFRGMVTNHDFMVLQGGSSTLLIRKVIESKSLEHLTEARGWLERTVATLSREGAKAHNISRVITTVTEKILNRAVALAADELGAPPAPYALFLLGEAGRGELSLCRSLELGVVVDLPPGESTYFLRLQELLCRASGAHGATGPLVRREYIRSLEGWRNLSRQWMAGSEKAAVPLSSLLELRVVAGDAGALEKLRLELIETIANDDALLARLAAETVRNRPPLGFLGRLVVETSGEHRNELDLYEKGIRPLAEAVRILAIAKTIDGRSTRKRVRALATHHSFAPAEEIENAFEYLQTLRIHQQLDLIQGRDKPDNFLNPADLVNDERKTLKEAFQLVVSLHDLLARRYPDPAEVQ